MWNSLPAHSAWPDGVMEGQAGHRLVRDLGVHAHHLRPLQRLDEVQRVADGRQEDVPARLVGLGLHREAQVVAVVDHVVAEDVDRLAVALQRVARVLRHARLGALAAAPEHVHLGAQLGGGVDEVHRLADRRPAHAAVVGRERAVLERRVPEQVRRRHPDAHPGLVQRPLEARDDPVLLRLRAPERDQVVVVQRHAPRPELGQLVDRVDRIDGFAGRPAERVAPWVAHGPQTEREAMPRTRFNRPFGDSWFLDDRHVSPPALIRLSAELIPLCQTRQGFCRWRRGKSYVFVTLSDNPL